MYYQDTGQVIDSPSLQLSLVSVIALQTSMPRACTLAQTFTQSVKHTDARLSPLIWRRKRKYNYFCSIWITLGRRKYLQEHLWSGNGIHEAECTDHSPSNSEQCIFANCIITYTFVCLDLCVCMNAVDFYFIHRHTHRTRCCRVKVTDAIIVYFSYTVWGSYFVNITLTQ